MKNQAKTRGFLRFVAGAQRVQVWVAMSINTKNAAQAVITCALVLAAVVMSASPALAAERLPVYFSVSAKDTVGARFAYQMKERFRTSQTYEIVLREKDARFHIAILTMDPDDEGTQTVVSMVLSLENDNGYDYTYKHWIVTAGANRVSSMVDSMIASIDQDVQGFLKDLAAAANK